MSGEAELTGREHNSPKGAPHPSITSQWEQTTARHNVLKCGRLFRLGLAVQVVSGTAKSFHSGAETCFSGWMSVTRLTRRKMLILFLGMENKSCRFHDLTLAALNLPSVTFGLGVRSA